jgi:acetolactate synthase regulatory subunit
MQRQYHLGKAPDPALAQRRTATTLSRSVCAVPRRGCTILEVTIYDELRGLLEALEADKVEYALVGALAVAVWGAPRATKDIDLLVHPSDLPRVLEVAKQRGFTLAGLPIEFKDGTEMRRVNKVDAAGNLTTLDLMLVDTNLAEPWASRIQLPFGPGHVTVVSRDALIGMKARAARPQDLMDIQNLQDIDR